MNLPEVVQPRAGGRRICIIHKNEPGMISQITALTTEAGGEALHKRVDAVVTVPEAEAMLLPQLGVIPLQLLSYYTALERGCDIDKPRNLAKSVTVE